MASIIDQANGIGIVTGPPIATLPPSTLGQPAVSTLPDDATLAVVVTQSTAIYDTRGAASFVTATQLVATPVVDRSTPTIATFSSSPSPESSNTFNNGTGTFSFTSSSSTTTPSSPPPSSPSQSGLSSSTKIALGLGIPLGLIILSIIAFLILRHHKHRKNLRRAQHGSLPAVESHQAVVGGDGEKGGLPEIFGTEVTASAKELPGSPGVRRHELPDGFHAR